MGVTYISRWIALSVVLCMMAACGTDGGTEETDAGANNGGGSDGGGDGGTDGGGTDGGGGDGEEGTDPISSSPLNFVSDDERDAFLDILNQNYPNMIAEAVEGGATPFDNLSPAMGTIDYTGYMNVIATVLSPAVGANILGDVTLSADFSSNSITGTAENFHEAISTLDGEAIPLSVVSYDGALAITNGVISGVSGESSTFTLEVDGSLDDGVKTLAVSGQIDGAFYDADATGLRAYAGVSSTNGLDVTIDGTAAMAGATIVAIAD